MANISDVAQFAGVSTATVSRVVNNPNQVNLKTRTHVQEVIAQLNYRPNRAAQVLKRQASRTVGVVVNRFGSPYFGDLMEGIEQSLRDVGYKTIAEASHETAAGQVAAWMSLIDRQCESFIVHADAVPEAELSHLMVQYPRSVLINRALPDFADRCVYLNNVDGGRLAATHLLAQGHRDFAIMTGPMDLNEVRDRQTGFLAALAEAGVTVPAARIVNGGFIEESAVAVMNDLLATRDFTAIFAHNDLMAAGIIEACRAQGVRVPDDVSVVGFDDLDLARHLTPKLTSVRQPLQAIGATAGRLAHALARAQDKTDDIPKVFAAELVDRRSVLKMAD